MNRRASPVKPQRHSLRRLLRRTQLRSMLLVIGLTSLTLLGVMALRAYAEHHLHRWPAHGATPWKQPGSFRMPPRRRKAWS